MLNATSGLPRYKFKPFMKILPTQCKLSVSAVAILKSVLWCFGSCRIETQGPPIPEWIVRWGEYRGIAIAVRSSTIRVWIADEPTGTQIHGKSWTFWSGITPGTPQSRWRPTDCKYLRHRVIARLKMVVYVMKEGETDTMIRRSWHNQFKSLKLAGDDQTQRSALLWLPLACCYFRLSYCQYHQAFRWYSKQYVRVVVYMQGISGTRASRLKKRRSNCDHENYHKVYMPDSHEACWQGSIFLARKSSMINWSKTAGNNWKIWWRCQSSLWCLLCREQLLNIKASFGWCQKEGSLKLKMVGRFVLVRSWNLLGAWLV